MNRSVAVLGPGAVGGSLVVRLANAGVRTICVARPETTGIIALTGIVVESRGETLTARPEVSEELVEPVGLVLVTVKAPGLEEALERIDPAAVEDGVVVPLLNGLEHLEAVRTRFDGRVAAGSISHFQAFRVGRVQIVETTPAPLLTIASDQLPRSEVDAVAELLRSARMEVRVAQSEKRVLWHKAARMAALAAATAASGRTVGQLRTDPEWGPRLRDAVAEACRVADADGVGLRAAAQWEIIEDMDPQTTTSAARDVAAGRPSELDAVVGGVLRAGARLGVETPALRDLATRAGLA
jgi:2-dehydropantoate 2-reductase